MHWCNPRDGPEEALALSPDLNVQLSTLSVTRDLIGIGERKGKMQGALEPFSSLLAPPASASEAEAVERHQ